MIKEINDIINFCRILESNISDSYAEIRIYINNIVIKKSELGDCSKQKFLLYSSSAEFTLFI